MPDNMKRKAFRVTRLKVNDLPEESQQALLELFMTLEARKTDAVAAERVALRTAGEARVKRAQAESAEVEFLEHASSHFEQVASERIWFIYRDRDGAIVLESPFTERIQRNFIRAQNQALEKQTEDDNSGPTDLYEDTEEEGQS